jgi:molybdenum cofactor biosynthesis protein B
MGHHQHKEHAPRSVGVGVITVSTTRTEATDEGGDLLAKLAATAGHRVLARRLVQDDVFAIRQAVEDLSRVPELRAVLLTGGSGITRTDVTVEAIEGLVEAWLPGFGELFRQLSYQDIGSAAILSRAFAGVAQVDGGGRFLVAVLPGSPAAVRLAAQKLLLPELGHIVYELDR